jgi:hypothetical protein
VSEIAASATQGRSGRSTEFQLIAAALALIALADWLFWSHEPGIAFFVFYAAITVAIVVVRRDQPARLLFLGSAIALAGALPLVEAPSLWGILSATFGVALLALIGAQKLPAQLVDLPATLVRYGVIAPILLARDAFRSTVVLVDGGWASKFVRGLLVWVVPLLLALVFLGLFVLANPLIEAALDAISLRSVTDLLDPVRIIFWIIVAAFVWPLLAPQLLQWQPAEMQGPHLPKAESIIFGASAILRALLVFNALFAVQTVLDLAYLWGGVRLPEGMTYADYAHRGAYPLIVTALLAAGFVLAAMRPNGAAERSPLIRRLVYLFIAQNVLLVVSSILRLDLYVEIYSLTELRVAAGIWMGLVAVGLVLILVRIAARKSSKWLIAMNLASLGLTLYVCAYVDFSALVARYNVEHSFELTGKGTVLDTCYFYELGPTAIPALDEFISRVGPRKGKEPCNSAADQRRFMAQDFISRQQDWRDWTFRDWRLDQYLSGRVAENARAGENSPDPR